jgi:excisionase family DNA binding protein
MMDRLMGIKETAALLGRPEGTVRYWVHIGYGPPSARFGRRRVFRESEVRAWIDAQFAAAAQDRRVG